MIKNNYKNYIPDENGRRYSITQDSQNYTKIKDETNYIQEGDNFGANDINAIATLINNGLGELWLDFVETLSDLEQTYPAANFPSYKCLVRDINKIYQSNGVVWQQDGGTSGVQVVTIPSQDWETKTDAKGKTYYSIDVPVEGMTAAYEGLASKLDYVRPEPYDVDDDDKFRELFMLVREWRSKDGYLVAIASEIPSQPFDVYLYGLNASASENNDSEPNEPEEPEIADEEPTIPDVTNAGGN